MKTKHILFLGLAVAFSSCSTAYRSGQTPDDVYYSPAPPQDAYVRTDNQDERESYAYNNTTNREDLDIRRGIRDSRYRDNNVIVELGVGGYVPYAYDQYGYNSYGFNSYGYNPYSSHGYGYGYNNLYYNPYNLYNNSFYVSPYNNYYYAPQVYVYPGTTGVRTPVAPRRYNLGAYNNSLNTVRSTNNYDRPVNTSSSPVRTFTTRSQNNGSGAGNLIRRVFSSDNNNSNNSSNTRSFRNDNNSNNNTNSSPVRSTTTPSSSNSSSSGSSSAPVRTFKR
ncbi:MAG: hypothetical protein ABI594_00590 [Ginsengibacter sp.]